MSESKRTNLGRGLAALLGEEEEEDVPLSETQDEATPRSTRETRRLPIERLEPNPYQPRRAFDEEAIEALAESIRANGLLQPILVRPRTGAGEGYEIVAGERRWRAAQRAQLHEVPVVVRELTDREALEVAIVENVQRRDLTPLEEAEGYRRLMEEFAHTQENLAQVVGKSRSHIANMLRLLQLPEPVKALVQEGRLSAGHARALLGAEDADELAEMVAEQGLSVRETERLAQEVRRAAGQEPQSRPRAKSKAPAKDADTRALEEDLSSLLGVRVSIDHHGEGRGGAVTLRYRSLDQLDDVLHRLMYGPPKGRGE